MHALFAHPDQLAALRADPDGVLTTAIEELLRYVSPVVYMRRRATRDTELRGVPNEEGDRGVMYNGDANRDHVVFERTHEHDKRRSHTHHGDLGGGGQTFCLGSHTSRTTIETLL